MSSTATGRSSAASRAPSGRWWSWPWPSRHIKILSFVSRLPAGARQALWGLTDLAVAAFCALLVVNGIRAMTIFEWSQRTIALPVELPRYLFYSTPLILGAASMMRTAGYDLLLVLARGPRERRAAVEPGAEALPL